MRWFLETWIAALAAALAIGGCGKQESELPKVNIHDAARVGEMDALRQHVAWGADLDKKDRNGSTPLTLAIDNGKIEAVKFLLDKGAKATVPDSRGRMPIGYATSQPSGAAEMVSALLDKGLDVNDKSAGDTALHQATWQNSIELARMLLSRKADPSATDSVQRQPLHIAAARGYADLVGLLLQSGAPVAAKDADGNTPLHLAVEGFASANLGADSQQTAPYTQIINQLLSKGADPNLPGAANRTALHLAAAARSEPLVELLLSKGASPKLQTTGPADTALHVAINQSAAPIVAMLLDKGADASAVAADGRTALQMAVGKGSAVMVQMLLSKNADPAATGNVGKTPLQIAQESSNSREIAKLLQAKSASSTTSPLHQAVRQHDLDAVKRLIAGGAAIDAPDDLGQTPLHVAVTWVFQDERPEAVQRAIAVAKALLDAKASPNAKDAQGFTPLNFAVAQSAAARSAWSRQRAETLADVFTQTARLLVSAGADVNARDKEEQTPLHQAARIRARAAVAFLLENKADPTLRDRYGRLATEYARESNDVEIRRLLPDK